MMLAWIVGQNETSILGEGWYGRCPDWFGLPFRESFGRCSLRIPSNRPRRITLVVGSALCFHQPDQSLHIRCQERDWTFRLVPQPEGYGWQVLTLDLDGLSPVHDFLEFSLEAEKWRHGDLEPVQDFREVGLLLGAVFLFE